MTGIAVEHLTKRFGMVDAVVDTSFTAEPGRVTGFLGPNGAGKSTTLRMLLGLIRPDAGTARFGGVPYVDLPFPTGTVGAVLDIASAHPATTARAHLRTYCALGGHPVRRVGEVIDSVELDRFADRRVGTYSTGMRQRLALATALLGDPEVLVLDEPSNGLDPSGIVWLRTFLREFAAGGGTVLISSHALSELQNTIDDVVLIDRGHIAWTGELSELVATGDTLEEAFLSLTERAVVK
ncbi:ATP-binding cassette domain-containing protein [Rhodococcus sp. HNM0563]|uniref:ABC transporter ATP-binding protein n=1 Tax=unclassified Rhodococcus (in: high G+C Gram-positive bacteria) TaxID=192944 RepID=UPI00146F65EA|nr:MULTISPECIES: ATP-binding cassette domain-containing protein [unclassified Rhodococcus (in: high G+C Gram-positive bacteria)]MCK0092575.1 ATP-binding cassette domain-containing protein [Rhodococcus sp. F64268]NLU64341.1 ATP-binding cassette domain-containing protein [Rhodococcus sp. HNM0563]